MVIKPTVVSNMGEARDVSEEYRQRMRSLQRFDFSERIGEED